VKEHQEIGGNCLLRLAELFACRNHDSQNHNKRSSNGQHKLDAVVHELWMLSVSAFLAIPPPLPALPNPVETLQAAHHHRPNEFTGNCMGNP
jgi:hypothetical protein